MWVVNRKYSVVGDPSVDGPPLPGPNVPSVPTPSVLPAWGGEGVGFPSSFCFPQATLIPVIYLLFNLAFPLFSCIMKTLSWIQ